MNMSTREFVMVVHTFPVDNGFVADKHAIQTAYRKHPTQNSMRCVSDVLDEIGVNHEVCSLESCSDVDLDGKILFVPYELNPLRFVSGHCMDTLTLYDGKVKTDVPLRKIETHLPLYVIQTDGHALDKKARCNVGCYFRNVIWDLGDNGLKALMFVFLLALIFINPISLSTFLLRLCLFCGLAVSSSIVFNEFFGTDDGKGLCDIVGSRGCRTVTDNADSSLFGQIPLGDLALTYFLVEFILSLTIRDATVFPSFLYISCLTLPIVAYSLVFQLNKRTFCVYCLLVDFLLAMEFLLLLMAASLPWDINVGYILCFTFGCISVLFMITILRNNSLDRYTYKKLRRKEEIILSDQALFMNLLNSERRLVSREELNFPTVNNGLHEYEHWLLVALNPYCPHCQELVKELSALENVRIDVIFTVYDQTGVNAASWILEEYDANMEDSDMHAVLDRWYSSMEVPRGWKVNAEYERMALRHSSFAKTKRIKETPFICVDGRLLPEMYDYTELRFLF